MKNLNDFQEEKKEEAKKETKLKKDQGTDDKKYIALMGEYKKLRRNPDNRPQAKKVFDKALKLSKDGDVSTKAKVAAAYL